MIKRILEYRIPTEYCGRKIDCFLEDSGYPQQAITNLRKEPGLLLVNNEIVFMNYCFKTQDEILKVVIKEEETDKTFNEANIPLDIIYEDEDIVVINKPYGMPVHPSINHYDNTLANALSFYFKEKNEPFVFRCVNRLDRDTSGITIIAKHYLASGLLSEQMRNRQIKREYTAIVEGLILEDRGTIDLPIAREDESVITRVVDFEKGEKAVTHFRVIKRDEDQNLTLVKLVLETGRTHQIRVHMKAIGHPLIGDFLYNPDNKMINRQALHAGCIDFIHPLTGLPMHFEVDLPEDMKEIMSV